MTDVGEREIRTERRVVGFFRDALGYDYLGHWRDRTDNRNVEEGLLRDWLGRQGYVEAVITRALHDLDRAAAVSGSRGIHDANREVYERLRYGVIETPEKHWLRWKEAEAHPAAGGTRRPGQRPSGPQA